ncbi:hypothetical protein K491DRAFT_194609 [Lophiostoma macrostomum CBS 122681]|uniref:Uncharacterized protein n=1 Tax=Lophiostoma macrostomum CBS 122681 TaxID=1314788 RepID=A0A6A6TKE5_9PLEO|nr:hypothetical protein K491DRAFT_194609 [Lophiostoma macrostomum CBS 122681]
MSLQSSLTETLLSSCCIYCLVCSSSYPIPKITLFLGLKVDFADSFASLQAHARSHTCDRTDEKRSTMSPCWGRCWLWSLARPATQRPVVTMLQR